MAQNTAKKIDLFGDNSKTVAVEPEVQQEQEVNAIVTEAKALVVTNEQQANAVTAFINRCKATIKKIKEHHAPMKQKAHEAWKSTVAAEKALLDPLEQAVKLANKAHADFFAEQERIRKQEQARLERERAEKEKAMIAEAQKRIESLLDDSRSVEEKIEALEVEVEAGADDITAGIIRASIRALESAGDVTFGTIEALEAEIEAEVTTATVAEVVPETKVSGVVKKYKYTAEVTDMVALCQAIGEGKVPPGVVKVAQGPLNAHARAMQGKEIPGCKVSKTLSTHTRG